MVDKDIGVLFATTILHYW